MKYCFLNHKANGQLWRAGNKVYGLCAAHNFSTDPGLYMTDREHTLSARYARAIRNRMRRLGIAVDIDYWETENGTYFPARFVKERDRWLKHYRKSQGRDY